MSKKSAHEKKSRIFRNKIWRQCFSTACFHPYSFRTWKIPIDYFSKSTWGDQPVEDIPNFTSICVYVFICRGRGERMGKTDHKAILLSFMSSKPFSDWLSSENSQKARVFRKFSPIEILFFKNFKMIVESF